MKNKTIEDSLPQDENGQDTVEFLEAVKKQLQLVSTSHPGSLGFHPLIYYYARSGQFLSNAFLTSLVFSQRLDKENRKKDFTRVRRRFEEYLHANKLFVTLTISRLGSGARSLDRLADLYWSVFKEIHLDHSNDEIFQALVARNDFVHLKQIQIPPPSFDSPPSKRGASRETKSSAFIREALKNPVRCSICDGAIHSNSVTFDHIKQKGEGGDNQSDNLGPSHPYCNSGFKG